MPKKYDPEFRERALRMLDEARADHPSRMSAVRHVAGLLNMSAETLRTWSRDEIVGDPAPHVGRTTAVYRARTRLPSSRLNWRSSFLGFSRAKFGCH